MADLDAKCAHTCKGLCKALEIASMNERTAILHYADLRDSCTYPEVKTMLNDLIIEKKKAIELLEKTKELVRGKFGVLDQIRDGYELE
jgi:rubrerythrin